ncbi:MAG: cobalamin biosynthesis protein CobQ [Alphaproteobacteria bacterium]
MMTQSHALLAMALFGKPNSNARCLGAVSGGLLPDLTMLYMYGVERLRGNSDAKIFNELYFSDAWQEVFAINNSAPVFAVIALVAFMLSRLVGWLWALSFSFALGLGALLHALFDLPLHHDDGHPHFWPLTNWIYESPVSYWDPRHYGTWASNIELAFIAGVSIYLWVKFKRLYQRILVGLLFGSYVAMII